MSEWDSILGPNPLEANQPVEAPGNLSGDPKQFSSAPGQMLPKVPGLALKAAVEGTKIAPMVGTGLVTDWATGGLALPYQLAAGAGAMGAYDLATGQGGAQAAVDAILSLLGGGVGAAASKVLKLPKAVGWAERRSLGKAMGGAGEVIEAPAAKRGAAAIGMPDLPAQTYVHPDRFNQVVQHSALKTEDTQALNREVQQRGADTLREMTAREQPLLDTHQQVTDLLKTQGEAGAAEARRIVGQYLRTEDPVVRTRLVQAAGQGNLDLREAVLQRDFAKLDQTNLGQESVDFGPLYDRMAASENKFILKGQVSRLNSMAEDIRDRNTPAPTALEGPVKTQDITKTDVPMPEEFNQRKGLVTDAITQVDDFLKRQGKVRTSQRIRFKDETGVTHTTQVSGEFATEAPKIDPNQFSNFSTARQLRTELMSVRRAREGESNQITGELDQWISTLDGQIDKAGEGLSGTSRAAYEEWRRINPLYKEFKATQNDPFTKTILESANPKEVLGTVRNPAQLDQIKALLTDADGNLSPQWEELRGTLLQQSLDKASRGDGTYDAAAVSKYLFGDGSAEGELRRAATQRLFTPAELKQFGTSLEKHQTAVDLANAIGGDSTELVSRIVGMDPARSETLWRSLDAHPNVQDAVRGNLLREFIGAGPDGVFDPDAILANIAKVKGLDPRKLEMMFPAQSAREWRPALERANEISIAMKLSDARLGKRIPTDSGQFLNYIKHRVVWEGAGAVASGFTSKSLVGGTEAAAVILSAELTWRALKSKTAANWLKFAVTTTGPRAVGRVGAVAGARATYGFLKTLVDQNLVPPGEVSSINKQLEDAKVAAGITTDNVRLQDHEKSIIRVPIGTLDAAQRGNKGTPP
jgi:hypothetical protein